MLECQKHLFSLEESVHYLNCAYMSPLLKSVEEAGIEGMRRKRTPAGVLPKDYFNDAEQVRILFASLINSEASRIAIIPSVSYGMGIISRNFPASRGKEVVTVHEEFPSDVYALHRISLEHGMKIITVKPPVEIPGRGRKWNELILESITRDTALVNISSIHWADGTIFDLQAISKRAKEVGALFVVDGTQSVGAIPFDIKNIPVDALICAGYKWLLGPYSTGCMYLGSYFDEGIPIEESWLNREGSDNFRELVNYNAAPPYRQGAARYNMGEYSNFINLPMLKTSLQQLLSWGNNAVPEYCGALTQSFTDTLINNGFGLEEDLFRAKHLFGCRLPGHVSLEAVQKNLDENKVSVSLRGNAIRISPHLYNNADDIERLQVSLLH